MAHTKGALHPEDVGENAWPNRGEPEPGEYPFTWGLYPAMYRTQDGGKKPTIREFAGHGLASDTNERFRLILAEGGTGLSTAFDLPTLMGFDSDDEVCEGQVGWDGVAVDSLADMEELFAGIPIDRVTVSMTNNAPAAVMWAMYLAMAKRRGIPFALLGGTMQNDILKEYLAQKEWLFPEEHGVKLVVDTIEYAARHVPHWHPVSISGYHIREAGATAVQESAYMLADGIAYVEACVARGLRVDDFAPQLSFFPDVHNNFWEEVAKLCAIRKLWARIMRERFHAQNPKAWWCRMHVQTAGVTLTRQEPPNNIVRVAFQALAGYLGGAQSVHTNSYDEVLCTPTEEAVRVAIRTQQIIQEEIGICDFIAPLRGSRVLENMIREIEEEASVEIARIDAMGGMVEAIKQGYPQRMIRASAFEQEQKIESGALPIVGVTTFRSGNTQEPRNVREELQRRRGFEDRQIARLQELKMRRNDPQVREALDHIYDTAAAGTNVMDALIEAASAYATIGEMSRALQDVYGVYREYDRDFSTPQFNKTMQRVVRQYRLPHPLRIMVAKGGLDGHDRIVNTILEFYKRLGAEAMFPGLHCPMRAVAKRAVEEDVDIVAISTHIGNPLVYFERLRRHLSQYGKNDITIIGGGIITSDDLAALPVFGVTHFAPPGTSFEEIAQFLYQEAVRRENA